MDKKQRISHQGAQKLNPKIWINQVSQKNI